VLDAELLVVRPQLQQLLVEVGEPVGQVEDPRVGDLEVLEGLDEGEPVDGLGQRGRAARGRARLVDGRCGVLGHGLPS
jgi:hypothetical protein